MSDLADIVEGLCIAVARGESARAHPLAQLAATKLGEPRASRIKKAFRRRPPPASLKHWERVEEARKPFVPPFVWVEVEQWLRELDGAEALAQAGERVLPLLLSGETRCGKTSLASAIARKRRLPVYRLTLSQAVGSHIGESSKCIEAAFAEARHHAAVWLVDEIDAVAFERRHGQGAEQERSHAIGAMLTLIEELPPTFALIGTTNHKASIDPAVLGRFHCVEWTPWQELEMDDRREFLDTHGAKDLWEQTPESYAHAVKLARTERVESLLAPAEVKAS